MTQVPQGDVLTAEEVADDLRCSRAHVYNLLNGKVRGVSPLPYICMGRKRGIRRTSLEAWKAANERTVCANATIRSSPDVDAAGA